MITIDKLVKFLNEHHVTVLGSTDTTITVVGHYTYRDSNNVVCSGSEHQTIAATLPAVRNWLNY